MQKQSRPQALPSDHGGTRVQAAGVPSPAGPGSPHRATHEVQVRCPPEAGPPTVHLQGKGRTPGSHFMRWVPNRDSGLGLGQQH